MKARLDPKVLHSIAQDVVAQNLDTEATIAAVREKVAEHYPHLMSKTPRCWMGSRAGGILGKMTLLYGSMTEYLIIFGCPTASQGFSGRYNFVEIWDFYLTGKTLVCDLESDQVVATVRGPGDKGFLAKGQAFSCDIKADSWMLEYGRGLIFTALPFALMDSLLSSLELKSFYLTVKEYTYFAVKQIFK